MKYYYSPSQNAFYPEELLSTYKKAGTFPADAVEVPYSAFKDFSLTQAPAGFSRKYKDGKFGWEVNEISQEAACAIEEQWVALELDRTRYELEKVQDSDPRARGTVSQWREYRKALRSWPEHNDFPDASSRPASPDNK